VLTFIGIIFAIRALSSRSAGKAAATPAHTNNLASGSEVDGAAAVSADTAASPPNAGASPGSTDSATNAPTTWHSGPDAANDNVKQTLLRLDGLNIELGHIERSLDAQLAVPDTTVYRRISDNTRQCVQVQLAILKRAAGAKGAEAECDRFQTAMDTLQQLDDAPYYSGLITAYSRLMAEATVTVCDILNGETAAPESQRMQSELAVIRRSRLEATCDATFVTAAALLSASKTRAGTAVNTLTWSELERNMQNQRAQELHVVRKTETAHRALCDVLARCMRVSDPTGKIAETVTRIEKERDGEVAQAKDSFIRIAAYTEAEARLMVLWARSLER
jgi:hypothetical protein